jgi:hypothetical protein
MERGLGKADDLMLEKYAQLRDQFLCDLFEPGEISYGDLFSYYDYKWRRIAKSFRSRISKANKSRLKIICNLDAFAEEFKPLEAA